MLRWTGHNLTLFPPEDLDQVRAVAEFLATDHGPITVVASNGAFVFAPPEVLEGLSAVMVALSAGSPVVIEPGNPTEFSNPAGLQPTTVRPPSNWEDASQVAHFLNTDDPDPVALVAADGTRVELPPEAHTALLKVAMSLSGRLSVYLEPISYHLTIDEAADLLDANRDRIEGYTHDGTIPTLQHPQDPERPLDLRDVLDYQERFRAFQREGVTWLIRDAQEQGLYENEISVEEAARMIKEDRAQRGRAAETD